MNSAVLLMALVLLIMYWGRTNSIISLDDNQQAQLDLLSNITRFELGQINRTAMGAPLSELNLTGIRQSRTPSALNAYIPKPLEHPLSELWQEHGAVFYHNITSILHGVYTSIPDIDPVKLDLSAYNETLDNYTLGVPPTGKVAFFLKETLEHNTTQVINADLELADNDPVALMGFYLPNGHMVMATNTLKFSGVGALPWISPPAGFEDARQLLVEQAPKSLRYQDFINKLEDSRQCEWVMWGRVNNVPATQTELDSIEKELRSPKGRPITHPPRVELEAVLYSPDCAAAFSLDLRGERSEQFRQRLRHALVFLLGLFVAAHALTILQVQRINTPTANFRVSFWTVAIMTLTDGLVCMSCMLATYEKSFALQLMAIVVEVFCFITIIQLDYLVGVFQAQQRGSGASELSQSQVTSLIYSRLYLVLLFLCLFSVSSYSFTEAHRSAYEWVLFVVLFSNWWPQIWRNVRRGISRPFKLGYVYGISALRLIPVLYICFYPNNVGYHHYDPTLGWVLIAWQWLQVVLLSFQYVLGGQFFLPERLCSHIYDYHPIVTADLETLLEDPECAICMSPVTLVTSNSPSEILARRKYMITPCRHVFHTDCLEEWIKRKLECPVCRSALPCN